MSVREFLSWKTASAIAVLGVLQAPTVDQSASTPELAGNVVGILLMSFLLTYAVWWMVRRYRSSESTDVKDVETTSGGWLFSTSAPTTPRSMMGYWLGLWLVVLIGAALFSAETVAIVAIGMQFVLPIGWFALIAWDVRTLDDKLEGSGNFLYPFLALFSGVGVLVYLWDRERHLTDSV